MNVHWSQAGSQMLAEDERGRIAEDTSKHAAVINLLSDARTRDRYTCLELTETRGVAGDSAKFSEMWRKV